MTELANTDELSSIEPHVYARALVLDYMDSHLEVGEEYTTNDIKLVWFTKTLKNWKAMIADIRPEGYFFEVTYNGIKKEAYLDVYKKIDNVRISDWVWKKSSKCVSDHHCVEVKMWKTSSYCGGGSCVEVSLNNESEEMQTNWQKSTRCSGGTCVEAKSDGQNVISVRNNQRPEIIVTFDKEEWATFVAGVKNGEFD